MPRRPCPRLRRRDQAGVGHGSARRVKLKDARESHEVRAGTKPVAEKLKARKRAEAVKTFMEGARAFLPTVAADLKSDKTRVVSRAALLGEVVYKNGKVNKAEAGAPCSARFVRSNPRRPGDCAGVSSSMARAATPLVVGTGIRYYLLVQYEWDKRKAADNLRKHGVDFADAIAVLEDPNRLEHIDLRFAYGEERMQVIGLAHQHVLFVTATMRDDDICRIISVRKATRHEQDRYYAGDRETW